MHSCSAILCGSFLVQLPSESQYANNVTFQFLNATILWIRRLCREPPDRTTLRHHCYEKATCSLSILTRSVVPVLNQKITTQPALCGHSLLSNQALTPPWASHETGLMSQDCQRQTEPLAGTSSASVVPRVSFHQRH